MGFGPSIIVLLVDDGLCSKWQSITKIFCSKKNSL